MRQEDVLKGMAVVFSREVDALLRGANFDREVIELATVKLRHAASALEAAVEARDAGVTEDLTNVVAALLRAGVRSVEVQ